MRVEKSGWSFETGVGIYLSGRWMPHVKYGMTSRFILAARRTCCRGLLDGGARPENRCGPDSKVNFPASVQRVKECAAPPGVVCASRVMLVRPCVVKRAEADNAPRPEPMVIVSYTVSSGDVVHVGHVRRPLFEERG